MVRDVWGLNVEVAGERHHNIAFVWSLQGTTSFLTFAFEYSLSIKEVVETGNFFCGVPGWAGEQCIEGHICTHQH
jgi:hypothetical protein